MSLIQPRAPRVENEILPNGLRFTIPSRKLWFGMLFSAFWLIGWAVGEIIVAAILIGGLFYLIIDGFPADITLSDYIQVAVFLTAWLAFWTYGGISAIRSLAWELTGKEIITLTHDFLIVEYKAMGTKQAKEYQMNHLDCIRLNFPAASQKRTFFTGPKEGAIAMNYDDATVFFGIELDLDEARMILADIQTVWPEKCQGSVTELDWEYV